jgi:hypothetical protein
MFFPQASHTVPMARRARLAAGTSAMKYKRIKIEQENKKQEIKKWQTIRMSPNRSQGD